MTATGFLEQKPRSPTGFGLVLLLHGAAIAGVVMIKGPEIVGRDVPLIADLIREPTPPPPIDPPRPVEREQIPLPTPPAPHVPDRVVETIPTSDRTFADAAETDRYDSRPAGPVSGSGGGTTVIPPIDRPRPTPVRIEALFDSRGGEQQPPYPVAELRAEREGNVRVEVRIGANGRVLAVSRLSATSDAFWRATERHALARWRFRPATEDGRPVESSKTLTVHFRLDGS